MPKLVTVNQLCISPFNVRLNGEDAEATTLLEASIAGRGLAQPHVDPDAFREWHKLPDPTLTGACAGVVDQVPGWVHPLLSFGVASEHDSAEQREAAE